MKDKVNEIKISYKEKKTISIADSFTNSNDVAKFIFKNWNKNTIGLQESFKVILLNNSNKVKGIYQLSNGGLTATIVDLRILFAVILKSLSVGIILVHNHPSGKLIPSEMDKRLTNKIINAADFLDIKVLDHLILAPDGSYFSFTDNGLI
jgi:DNA repair protein RadC